MTKQTCMAQYSESRFCTELGTHRLILGEDNCVFCKDHFWYFLQEEVKKGMDSFIDFALTNFGEEVTRTLVETYFEESGMKKLNEVLSNVDMVTMFTYGILKYPNKIKRDGGVDIVENCTVTGQKMFLYYLGYPITQVTGNENDVIYGTLFKIPKQTLVQYDRIEGYSPKRPPYANLYNREEVKVKTPTGEIVDAQMYIASPAQFSGEYNVPIPSGNFDDAGIPVGLFSGKRQNNRRKRDRR